MDPRSDTLSELQLIAENVRAGAITASSIKIRRITVGLKLE
jgi:hypothetical protein